MKVAITDGLGQSFEATLPLTVAGEVVPAPQPGPTPTPEPPVPTPPMLVAIDGGKWGLPGLEDVKACVPGIRLEAPSPKLKTAEEAGLKVVALFTPDNTGGVKAVNVQSFVQSVLAQLKETPNLWAIEALNEPAQPGFWGPEAGSAANAAAYGALLQALREKLGDPPVLASYDGGVTNSTAWGEAIHAAHPEAWEWIHGVTVHPYSSKNLEGHRSLVERAHQQTDLPVYVTEMGWNTSMVTEDEQAKALVDFIDWCRGTGYVRLVSIFNYRDYSPRQFWGIERWNNPAGPNGSKKPAYAAVQAISA